jgi:hypothetical protein
MAALIVTRAGPIPTPPMRLKFTISKGLIEENSVRILTTRTLLAIPMGDMATLTQLKAPIIHSEQVIRTLLHF